MSAKHSWTRVKFVLGQAVTILAVAGVATNLAIAQRPRLGGGSTSILGGGPNQMSHGAGSRTASAPTKPLARLIHNPDESGTNPPYALADQTGKIQRFVEPVPGIDLEPYVGYAVIVKHDTGRTLLASQLELPGPDYDATVDDLSSGSANSNGHRNRGGGGDSLFNGLLEPPSGSSNASNVQPAQYVAQSNAPIMIQEGGPQMMGPQGAMVYDSMDPGMGGYPPGAYPPGAEPIFLDGASSCGPQGCGTPGCTTCQPGYMQQPMPCAPPLPPPPQPQLMWSLWGDVLWLHPTGADMAHAQQQNGIGGAGTVPFGQIGVADPDYDLGFRIGGEVRISPKESIFGSFTWFESDASSSLNAPTIPGGGGAVGSLVHHPGAALTASAGPVDATYDIDFQMADLAYRYLVKCTCVSEISVFAGGRWGNLEQSFDQQGNFGGGLGGAVDTSTNIDFDGGGPMAGITGERLLGDTRFSVYGRSLVAALTGQFNTHYLMFNDTTDTTLAEVFWSDDRVVPMLDYELGFAWTGPDGHLRLAVGYMATYWFNAVTTPVYVDAVQADNYVDVADTIAFDGLVGHAEWRW